jgi:uncharacterized RDD family membrane protein YckC
MRSRFKPDADAGVSARPAAMLVDPEAYDASEQQFAASLEETLAQSQPRFVVEGAERIESAGASLIDEQNTEASVGRQDALQVPSENRILPAEQDVRALSSLMQTRAMPETAETPAVPPVLAKLIQEDASWRQEVAARVNNYRARRHPRGPRYPSLRLKFEASEPPLPTLATRQSLAMENVHSVSAGPEVRAAEPMAYTLPVPTITTEPTAKVLEFPRSAAGPPRPLDELAEPVLDRPRILEAPELVPPPPALGGILMDPAEEKENEKRPGFEMPLQPAPMSRRLVAVIMDATLVLSAFTGFAYIFFRITNVVPPLPQAAGIAVTFVGVFWAAYQYLLLVYAATTPGLRLAKLQLSRFDGSPVPRRIRRWRVLASVLSGVSLGLGYAWCFLDEDELCWHDRITRTYMAPRNVS